MGSGSSPISETRYLLNERTGSMDMGLLLQFVLLKNYYFSSKSNSKHTEFHFVQLISLQNSDCYKHCPSQPAFNSERKVLPCCRADSNLITLQVSVTCDMVKKRQLGPQVSICLTTSESLWSGPHSPPHPYIHTLKYIVKNSSSSISSHSD